MTVTPPIWLILLLAGPFALAGVGWAISLFWRKVSLVEIFLLMTFWAAIFGAMYWIR